MTCWKNWGRNEVFLKKYFLILTTEIMERGEFDSCTMSAIFILSFILSFRKIYFEKIFISVLSTDTFQNINTPIACADYNQHNFHSLC